MDSGCLRFLAAVWGLWVFHCDSNGSSLLEKLSAVGSYFQGAVGSLWALAGLMFIYVAFLGQKQQLLLQRQEMKEQEGQFRLQQKSIRKQNFETASVADFFQFVTTFNWSFLFKMISGQRRKQAILPVTSTLFPFRALISPN